MRGCISRGRRCPIPPSGISGRKASLCCSLSGFFDSLSSAGHVCWAKPNHGFFRCQHFGAIIFASRRARSPSARAVDTPSESAARPRDAAAHETTSHETAFFQCFFRRLQRRWECRKTFRESPRRMRACRMDACNGLKIFSAEARISALHKPICADLRKHPTASKRSDAGRAHRAGNKKPASSPARVRACNRRCASG